MKIIRHYLFPAMAQMTIACIIAAVCIAVSGDCPKPLQILLIAAGGISTALWGSIYQIRSNNKSIKAILKDFFHIGAGVKGYILAAVFLLLDFLPVSVGGSISVPWYRILIIFLTAILYGGIEEIGWRYTFQPCLEEKLPYIAATLVTFVCWGVWHFMFFYLDGSISIIKPLPFLLGLLTNCFILSAVYNYSRNLWLCAMTHALLNTFSQTIANDDTNIILEISTKIIIIVAAVIISKRAKEHQEVIE